MPPPLPPTPDQVIVRKDYDPKGMALPPSPGDVKESPDWSWVFFRWAVLGELEVTHMLQASWWERV